MFLLENKIKLRRYFIKSEDFDKFTKPRNGHEKGTLEVVNGHRKSVISAKGI